MQTLYCLLSEQPVPNLLSVHHFRPGHLILIESEEMKRRETASNFIEALKLGGLDYGTRHQVVSLSKVDSLQAMLEELAAVFDAARGEPVVNLTGGTKPMSIAAFEFFKTKSQDLVYVSADAPGVLRWLDSGRSVPMSHQFSVGEFLRAYGYRVATPAASAAESVRRAEAWWPLACRISREGCQAQLFTDRLLGNEDRRKQFRKRGGTLEPGDLEPTGDGLLTAIAQAFQLQIQRRCLLGAIDKYQAMFLSGGWLETFIWGLLRQNAPALRLHDVCLEVNVKKEASNELDVVFLRGQTLYTVECKSGRQSQDPGAEVLYKSIAVAKEFNALKVKSIVASTGGNLLDGKGELKKSIRERAEAYGIRVVKGSEIARLAEAPQDAARIGEIFHFATN